MHKKDRNVLIVFAGANVVVYLFGSFIQWDINPGNWNAIDRGTTAAIGALFGLFLAGGVAAT
jgi:hypothetical protein